MGLTKLSLTDTIKARLGGSGRAIELTPPDYDVAIASALKVLARFHPQEGFVSIPVTVGVQKYVVPGANILGVLDVTFYSSGPRLTYYPYPDAAVDQALMQGQLKEQERIYGDLPEWTSMLETDPSDSDTEKCYLYLSFNSDSFLDRGGRLPDYVSVTDAWYISPTDDKPTGLPRVRYDWQEWVTDYAVAEAKCILGAIRDKFKGIPGPDGQTLSIDGEMLRVDGEKAKADLVADIKLRQRQLPILID